jgi:hypothetical protein
MGVGVGLDSGKCEILMSLYGRSAYDAGRLSGGGAGAIAARSMEIEVR